MLMLELKNQMHNHKALQRLILKQDKMQIHLSGIRMTKMRVKGWKTKLVSITSHQKILISRDHKFTKATSKSIQMIMFPKAIELQQHK